MFDPHRPDFASTPVAPDRPSLDYEPAGSGEPAVVSIVTPYFDTGEIFLETVAAVRRQTLQAWEWIVVDDGSLDERAVAVLREAAGLDARIAIHRQENLGPAAARNAGVERSRGRYLCWLDSDDLIEPTFLEKCVWFLEAEPEFAFVNSWTVNFGSQELAWPYGFERGAGMLDANTAPAIAIVRRQAFLEVGGFDAAILDGHEDWEFWLRLAQAGHWGHTLPEYLAWYRQRPASRRQRLLQTDGAHERFASALASRYQGLRAAFPAPRRREPQPYETPRFDLPFANRIRRQPPASHVLFLLPWMVTGGADKINLDWIRDLVRSGSRVTVCATLESYHAWKPAFEALTEDVFVLRDFLPPAEIPRFLVYLVRSRSIDTVVVNASTLAYQLLPYLRASCPETAFVDLAHVAEPHWLNGGHPRFAVGYQELLDLNLVTTSALRAWMIERGADDSRIAICHTGIDVGEADPARFDRAAIRQSLGIADATPTLVYLGRLCAQKRPLFLCEILAGLRDAGCEFQALLVGDGELRPAVAARLGELRLTDRVRLLGSLPHRGCLEALAAGDVFLLPSAYEGISVALFEAMAMEVVPVTTDASGHAELVRPDCGVLIGPGEGELERYVEAVSRLLDDPDLRRRQGVAARARVRAEFDAERCFAGFSAALETARGNRRTRPRAAIPPGLARELATLAVETSRLNAVADLLWSHWQNTRGATAAPPRASDAAAAKRLFDYALDTRLANRILDRPLARRLGRWLVTAVERRRDRRRGP
ncbi:MAG: glycosyltransferase [Thermoanaerobaculia bacterium]|nr:glycosyltransferase [Thermoanaerobaculia bacterium]